MSDLKGKTWLELCEAAGGEHDPEKLLELITALNDELELMELTEKLQGASTVRDPLRSLPANFDDCSFSGRRWDSEFGTVTGADFASNLN